MVRCTQLYIYYYTIYTSGCLFKFHKIIVYRYFINNIGKFYQLYYLDQYMSMMVKNHFKRSHLYSISRVVYIAVLWSHYLGIGFYFVSNVVYQNNSYGPNTPNNCWIYNSSVDIKIATYHWTYKYFYALYYSIGNITTIAYGDIVPLNPT